MSLEKKVTKRLRRVRYSRTAVVLCLLLLIVFFVPVAFRASKQRNAVRTFNEYNATFFYNFEISQDWKTPFEKSSDVSMFKPSANSPMPEWLLKSAGIDFCHTVVGGDVLAKDLDSKRRISAIKNLNRMKFLNLTNWSGPKTSIDDIKFLAGHTSLEALNLYGNESLSEIDEIANFKQLRYLNLAKTNVTDLSPLAELSKLELLRIHSVELDPGELDKFRERHPNCHVEQTITSQN